MSYGKQQDSPSYLCIGGCTEMLLKGVHPNIVMVQGRWKSQAFLEYWHRIDVILPLFLGFTMGYPQVGFSHTAP